MMSDAKTVEHQAFDQKRIALALVLAAVVLVVFRNVLPPALLRVPESLVLPFADVINVIFAFARDDLGGAAADFQTAGIHRGQFARQTVQKLNAVKARQADFTRNVDAAIQTEQQATRADHVIGVIQKINVWAAGQHRMGHLATLQ